MPAESLSSAGTANARLVYMSDFLELLAADAANSSDFTDRSGISATDRARTVLFECLFNHLADDRVASLFTILGFEHDFTCYAIAGYPARSAARSRVDIEKIVADFGGTCLTAERPITGLTGADNGTGRTAVVALIRRRRRHAIRSGHAVLSESRSGLGCHRAVPPPPAAHR